MEKKNGREKGQSLEMIQGKTEDKSSSGGWDAGWFSFGAPEVEKEGEL